MDSMYHIYEIDMKIEGGMLDGAEERIKPGKNQICFDPILISCFGGRGKSGIFSEIGNIITTGLPHYMLHSVDNQIGAFYIL